MLNLSEHPINLDLKDRNKEVVNSEQPKTAGTADIRLRVAFVVLVGVLVVAAAYGYSTLRDAGLQISRVPEMIKSVTDLQTRLAAAEAAISNWTHDRQALVKRMTGLEHGLKSNLRQAHLYSDQVAGQLEKRIAERTQERNATVDARLSKIEASQGADRAQLARLENELASTRQEIASLQQTTASNLSSVRQQVAGNDRTIRKISEQLETHRVDFEAARNREIPIAPDVALEIRRTDVRHQNWSGWIRIQPENRFLWVNEHSIQQPVTFYRLEDGAKFDLVATRVARKTVVGYLLMPSGGVSPTTTSSTQSGTEGSGPTQAGQGGQ